MFYCSKENLIYSTLILLNMDAVILAGGKGSRMEDSLPKALVLAKDRPIITHQIEYLKNTGRIDKIILQIGYKADQIVNYIKENHPDENITFSIEDEPLGTGGAVKQGLQRATSDFVLVFNCDDITDINLKDLIAINQNTICIAHPILPFGLVKEEDSYAKFEEKPVLNEWVSCGWYYFNRKQMIEVLPDKGSIEYETFPKIKLRVHKHLGFWRSLNTKKDIIEFNEL